MYVGGGASAGRELVTPHSIDDCLGGEFCLGVQEQDGQESARCRRKRDLGSCKLDDHRAHRLDDRPWVYRISLHCNPFTS